MSCQRTPPTSLSPEDLWISRTFLLSKPKKSSGCHQIRTPGPKITNLATSVRGRDRKAIYTCVVSATHTYMHLRVKFLCRGPGGIGPSNVVRAKVVGAVGGVPHVVAVCPRQDAGEGGVEVEEGPGDDGVVVEGHVQSDDTDGIPYT